jgi:hypothetical protein
VRTDVEIPRSAWSAWHEAGKLRELRRPLTDGERQALTARRAELAPWVSGYHDSELDEVALALTYMFASFRSMRQTGPETVAQVDSSRRILAEFPCWAIEKACRSIQANGVWRDGAFDRQWPPSDAEIVATVRQETRLYGDTHRTMIALLEATVEK